jgi:hypothetical protein
MAKPARTAKTAPDTASPKETLEKLFEQRDRARPGSREETEAAGKIAEAVFPDSNAD